MNRGAAWEPASDGEVALYDALVAGDQERYFRALTRIELLLPVSADALAGRTPLGWATWTSNDHTHLLAFTSEQSMRTCLAEHAGAARRMPLGDLASNWPNHDWWLAVNPGLPIEGYLPSWFVVQLGRGDARLPRQAAAANSPPRDRLERVRALERAKAARSTEPVRVASTVGQRALPPRPEPQPLPLPPPPPIPPVAPAAPPPPPPLPPAFPEPSFAEAAFAEAFAEPAPVAQPAPEMSKNGKPRHGAPDPDFVPANSVEEQLFEAAEAGNTDAFLSTLLLATVLIPKSSGTTNGQWRPQPIDGEPHIVSYTSTQHIPTGLETVSIKFIKLISSWPDPSWSFAVNPGTPVGATLPGGQLLALASWAAEFGLGSEEEEEPKAAATTTTTTPSASKYPTPGRTSPELTVLQKAIAPSQVGYYLERGYDRVSGFVHRAHEVGHLRGAEQMRQALGLDWAGSPFMVGANEIYLLRWSAYRPNLYRIPYGGQTEAAMKAMQGWVIERAPFRGNGFAPGESKEIIAEFKVDSARLPHGTRLLKVRADGTEEMVAILDTDGQRWLRTDGQ